MYLNGSMMSNFVAFGRDMAIGGSAAAVAKTTIAPIERVKLLLQLQATSTQIPPGGHYNGIIDCLRRIPREQGVASLWRGNLTNVYRYFLAQALNFAFKDTYKGFFAPRNDAGFWRVFATNIASGGAAGVTAICITYPLDFARTRLSTDVGSGETRHFRGLWHCMRVIAENDGVRGLYRGISLSIPNVLIYRSIYFGMFDTAKSLLSDPRHASIMVTWVIAQSCTTLAGIVGYPLDTVRRRLVMQSGRQNHHYRNARHCCSTIYREEGGLRGFYKGALTNVFRGMGGALVLVFYDEIKKFV